MSRPVAKVDEHISARGSVHPSLIARVVTPSVSDKNNRPLRRPCFLHHPNAPQFPACVSQPMVMCSSIMCCEHPIITVHFGVQTCISTDHHRCSVNLRELTDQINHSLHQSYSANCPRASREISISAEALDVRCWMEGVTLVVR